LHPQTYWAARSHSGLGSFYSTQMDDERKALAEYKSTVDLLSTLILSGTDAVDTGVLEGKRVLTIMRMELLSDDLEDENWSELNEWYGILIENFHQENNLRYPSEYLRGLWYNKAGALKNLGELEKAVQAYDSALTIDPNDTSAKTRRQAILDTLSPPEIKKPSPAPKKPTKLQSSVASEEKPVSIDEVFQKGEKLLSNNDYDDVIKLYMQNLKGDTKNKRIESCLNSLSEYVDDQLSKGNYITHTIPESKLESVLQEIKGTQWEQRIQAKLAEVYIDWKEYKKAFTIIKTKVNQNDKQRLGNAALKSLSKYVDDQLSKGNYITHTIPESKLESVLRETKGTHWEQPVQAKLAEVYIGWKEYKKAFTIIKSKVSPTNRQRLGNAAIQSLSKYVDDQLRQGKYTDTEYELESVLRETKGTHWEQPIQKKLDYVRSKR